MSLSEYTFASTFVDSLPADPIEENYLREVKGACYSLVNPSRAHQPRLLATSSDLLEYLGFTEEDAQSSEFLNVFAGNTLLKGMKPFSMCYGGHQFGNWAGQLGDGRAISLGEKQAIDGTNQTLQLKGAGQTPYSRSADGLAVLRSSLREFVCSEAMYRLGVPTTRALTLVTTGDAVIRDMLYDGHPAPEPGAVVCRVAPSFIRFGNFEILAARRDTELLKQLADYTIGQDFPDLLKLTEPQKYLEWFEHVQDRTINMIVDWMRVGFVHGVMNTDNMSISGLTIDYGPYGWLEGYDPDWTPNTTDAQTRRYRYGQQPWVAQWNLLQLANSLVPLIGETKQLEATLNEFPKVYAERWDTAIRQKLGISETQEDDVSVVRSLEKVLLLTETDMTLFFRLLAELDIDQVLTSIDPLEHLIEAYYTPTQITSKEREQSNAWILLYAQLVKQQNRDLSKRQEQMNQVNPLYVPRNYLAQQAIDEIEKGSTEFLDDWMKVLENPYQKQANQEKFAGKRPEWARTRVGCSMLSCSS